NDTLVAGTATTGGAVSNDMTGNGGQDTFVFKDTATQTVGTNNTIEDFSQAQHDKIEFDGVADVSSINDLVGKITSDGTNTFIQAGADEVTLANFTGTLTAQDFLFNQYMAAGFSGTNSGGSITTNTLSQTTTDEQQFLATPQH